VKVHFMGGFAELGCGDLELEASNYADLVLKWLVIVQFCQNIF